MTPDVAGSPSNRGKVRFFDPESGEEWLPTSAAPGGAGFLRATAADVVPGEKLPDGGFGIFPASQAEYVVPHGYAVSSGASPIPNDPQTFTMARDYGLQARALKGGAQDPDLDKKLEVEWLMAERMTGRQSDPGAIRASIAHLTPEEKSARFAQYFSRNVTAENQALGGELERAGGFFGPAVTSPEGQGIVGQEAGQLAKDIGPTRTAAISAVHGAAAPLGPLYGLNDYDAAQQAGLSEQHPVISGVAGFAGQAISPPNLLLMAATAGLANPQTTGMFAPIVSKLAATSIPVAFTAEQTLSEQGRLPTATEAGTSAAAGLAAGPVGRLIGRQVAALPLVRNAIGAAVQRLPVTSKIAGGLAENAAGFVATNASLSYVQGKVYTTEDMERDVFSAIMMHAGSGAVRPGDVRAAIREAVRRDASQSPGSPQPQGGVAGRPAGEAPISPSDASGGAGNTPLPTTPPTTGGNAQGVAPPEARPAQGAAGGAGATPEEGMITIRPMQELRPQRAGAAPGPIQGTSAIQQEAPAVRGPEVTVPPEGVRGAAGSQGELIAGAAAPAEPPVAGQRAAPWSRAELEDLPTIRGKPGQQTLMQLAKQYMVSDLKGRATIINAILARQPVAKPPEASATGAPPPSAETPTPQGSEAQPTARSGASEPTALPKQTPEAQLWEAAKQAGVIPADAEFERLPAVHSDALQKLATQELARLTPQERTANRVVPNPRSIAEGLAIGLGDDDAAKYAKGELNPEMTRDQRKALATFRETSPEYKAYRDYKASTPEGQATAARKAVMAAEQRVQDRAQELIPEAFDAAHNELTARGGVLEKTSESGSRYYQMPDRSRVRVSDHAPNEATDQWMERHGVEDLRVDIEALYKARDEAQAQQKPQATGGQTSRSVEREASSEDLGHQQSTTESWKVKGDPNAYAQPGPAVVPAPALSGDRPEVRGGNAQGQAERKTLERYGQTRQQYLSQAVEHFRGGDDPALRKLALEVEAQGTGRKRVVPGDTIKQGDRLTIGNRTFAAVTDAAGDTHLIASDGTQIPYANTLGYFKVNAGGWDQSRRGLPVREVDMPEGTQAMHSGVPLPFTSADAAKLPPPTPEHWANASTWQNVKDTFTTRALPRTTRVAPRTAEALGHAANSETYAAALSDQMVQKVFGTAGPDFRSKFIAALTEDNLRELAHRFWTTGRLTDSRAVKTLVGDRQIFGSEKEYQDFISSPEFRRTAYLWKTTVEPVGDAQYKRLNYSDPDVQVDTRGLQTGVRMYLMPAARALEGANAEPLPADQPNQPRSARVGPDPLANPSGRGNYSTDPRAVVYGMLRPRLAKSSKLDVYDAAVKDRVAQWGTTDQPAPETAGRKWMPHSVSVPGESYASREKRTLYVRPDVDGEFVRALALNHRFFMHGLLGKVTGSLNSVQMWGGGDAVVHTINQVGTVAMQMSPGDLANIGRKFPGVNVLDAVARIAAKRQALTQALMGGGGEEGARLLEQRSELARLGALRPSPQQGGGEGTGSLAHNFITKNDEAARLVLEDMWHDAVDAGIVKDTSPAAHRDYINQLGNYNSRLMVPIQQTLRDAGLSPFIVAGRTMNANAVRAATGQTGFVPKSNATWARNLIANYFGTVATVVAFNLATTGRPLGRPGVPVGAIDLGSDDDQGKHRWFDPLKFSMMRRGLRTTGADAVMNTLRNGGSWDDMAGKAVEDVANAQIHPFTGPAVSAAVVAGWNREPRLGGRPLAPDQTGKGSQYAAQSKEALQQLNPLIAAGLESLAPKGGEQSGTQMENLQRRLGSMVGYGSSREPGTAAEQLAHKLRTQGLSQAPAPPEDQARRDLRSDLLRKYQADADEGQQALDQAVDSGKLTHDQASAIAKQGGTEPLLYAVKGLKAEDAAQVYDSATPEERKLIGSAVAGKIAGSRTLTTDQQDRLLAKHGITPPADLDIERAYAPLQEKATAREKYLKHLQERRDLQSAIDQADHDRDWTEGAELRSKQSTLRATLRANPPAALTGDQQGLLRQMQQYHTQRNVLERQLRSGNISQAQVDARLAPLAARIRRSMKP